MQNGTPIRSRLAALCAALIALAGCAPPQHRNIAHSEYGAAEFQRDQAECNRDNSHLVTHVTGYAEVKSNEVDDAKAGSCMAARGWQPASN